MHPLQMNLKITVTRKRLKIGADEKNDDSGDEKSAQKGSRIGRGGKGRGREGKRVRDSWTRRRKIVTYLALATHLGMQLGDVRSTSQVAKSFMGTGREAGPVCFVRSAIFGLAAHCVRYTAIPHPRLAAVNSRLRDEL